MITQIQLGNLFNENGRTVISGGGSGLDVESLVNELATAKRQPAVILEDKVKNNEKISTALGDFKKKLETLKDSANFLRSPSGVQNAADNIFDYRKSNISSNTSVAGSTYLDVTAVPGAGIGEFEIEVNQLATRNNYTTNTFALADVSSVAVGGGGPFNAGTLTLGAGGYTMTLTAGDTLNNVVAKINSVKNLSGVEASIIKVSNGNYRVSFKSLDTGAQNNYDINALNPGIFNTGFALLDDADDSSITFDGTTIMRSTNSIDDIVDGLTFNLKQTTPAATKLTVGVEADKDLAKQGIMNFVNAYNDLKLFAAKQTAVGDDGKPLTDSVLANNSTVSQIFSKITGELASVVDGITSGDPARLGDLGIKFADFPGDNETPFTRNILQVDEDKLDSVLESNFDKVRKVFEFDYVSDNANLQIFQRTNALNTSSVSLNINRTSDIYQATYNDPTTGLPVTVDFDYEELSDGSVVLTGPKNSAIDGLLMIYADSADATVNLSMSQGIGDRVFNSLDDTLDDTTGALTVALNALSDDNERYNTEITKIDDQISKYRDQLLDKFAALEKAISAANTLLQSLDAQSRAQQNS
ncbi:MAG: flagellar filament capping protein FliD [Rickettsiales bacterium]